jgi:hypothetical protein
MMRSANVYGCAMVVLYDDGGSQFTEAPYLIAAEGTILRFWFQIEADRNAQIVGSITRIGSRELYVRKDYGTVAIGDSITLKQEYDLQDMKADGMEVMA